MREVRYGNAKLGGRFVLGPMAAYTDVAFRLLCRKRGAAMCFTEFANANAMARGSQESWRLAKTCSEEMPVGIQIFGSDEKEMASACREISRKVSAGELFASCIDLNFGCPAISVVRAGAGAALLKNPEKVRAIVEACVGASEIPITAKIRSGYSSDNATAIAMAIERAGASGITVHWRTAREGRVRKDAWGSVGEVKRAVGMPVIGNGGAHSPELAVRFLRQTGCDAVMISSGALGNPGMFERANALLEGKEPAPVTWEEKLAGFEEYFSLAEKHGVLSAKRLRGHAIEFLSEMPGVKGARRMLNSAKTAGEISGVMHSFTPALGA